MQILYFDMTRRKSWPRLSTQNILCQSPKAKVLQPALSFQLLRMIRSLSTLLTHLNAPILQSDGHWGNLSMKTLRKVNVLLPFHTRKIRSGPAVRLDNRFRWAMGRRKGYPMCSSQNYQGEYCWCELAFFQGNHLKTWTEQLHSRSDSGKYESLNLHRFHLSRQPLPLEVGLWKYSCVLGPVKLQAWKMNSLSVIPKPSLFLLKNGRILVMTSSSSTGNVKDGDAFMVSSQGICMAEFSSQYTS